MHTPTAYHIPDTEVQLFRSQSLQWTYDVAVAFPRDYANHPGARHKAILVLDGNVMFGPAVAAARSQYLAGETEALFIIGLDTPREAGEGQSSLRRLKDFTVDTPNGLGQESTIFSYLMDLLHSAGIGPTAAFGGAPAFLHFLKEELLPWLARYYRIDTEDLGLYGQSAAGAFGAYALLAEPTLFSRAVLGSFSTLFFESVRPGLEKTRGNTRLNGPAKVFAAAADAELADPQQALTGEALAWLEGLGRMAPDKLQVTTTVFPRATHLSVAPMTLSAGIGHLWSTGYRYPDSLKRGQTPKNGH